MCSPKQPIHLKGYVRLKQAFVLVLTLLLLTGISIPATAATDDSTPDLAEPTLITDDNTPPPDAVTEPPTLATELVTTGDEPGLYITLKNVPQDLSEVTVKYSFGSSEHILENMISKAWYTNPNEDQALCQINEDGSIRLLCYQIYEHPLSAYLSEAVNTLWIQVSFSTQEYADGMDFDPVRFSHENTYEVPQTPPPFTADFELGWYSYSIIGHFSDFAPNVAQVSSTFSWDGVNYQSCGLSGPMRWNLQNMGDEDPTAKARLQNQDCAEYYAEPLKSFLEYKRDSFYLRLEITTEDGTVYYSQPALMSRKEIGTTPENLTPRPYMGFDMAVTEMRNDKGLSQDDDNYYAELVKYTYGQLQLTVGENATQEDIMALLPDTVPVRIRFWDKKTNKKVAYGDVDCKVNWKKLPTLSLTAGAPLTLQDMAEPLVIPAGTVVKTDLASYTLTQPITFKSRYDNDDINLILNPVALNEKPQVGLRENSDVNGNDVMSLAFWKKPSGATSIEAYAIADGTRTLICDLLSRRKVNHNQSHELYGYVTLFGVDEAPYSDYLSGAIGSFAIELNIKGGVYDGETVTLPWPNEYNLPDEVFDPFGGEGQENNAGSGSGDDSNEDGQRPNLPNNPPAGNGSNTSGNLDESLSDPIQPEQPTQSQPEVPATKPEISPDTQPTQAPTSSAETAPPASDVTDEKEPPIETITTITPEHETPPFSAPDIGDTISAPQTAQTTNGLPISVTVALVVLGGGTAAAVGVASASVTVKSGISKLLSLLRNFFFPK